MTAQIKPNIDQQSDQSRLIEYQVCQQSINANGSSFWTLSSIFIGFSAVLLGGIIYGLISNERVFNEFANPISLWASKTILTVQIITLIIGIAMILIYYLLMRWLKRIQFLNNKDYERMREIEITLWMRKS